MVFENTAYFLKVICTLYMPSCLRPGDEPPEICKTFGCDQFNKISTSNMNIWSNPCDDYYQHACANGLTSTDHIENFRRERNMKNERAFSNFIRSDQLNISSNTINGESIKFAIKKARSFYRSCIGMSERTFDNAETVFIERIMNEIGLPMKPPFENFPSMKYNYAKTLAKIQTAGLLRQFFVFETSTTLTTQVGDTLPVIKTHPLRFKLPNYETMVAMIRVVNELANVQLSASDQVLQLERVQAVEKFFNLMEEVHNKRFASLVDIENGQGSKIESTLEQEMNPLLQSNLELISRPNPDDSTEEDESVTMSLFEIKKISAEIFNRHASAMIRIDWSEYFATLFENVPGAASFNENSKIIIENFNEFKEILNLLASTSHEVFVSALWIAVMQPITLLFDSSRWPNVLDFQSTVTRSEFRRRFCLIATQNQFPEVVIYALNQTPDEPFREEIHEEVESFVENIKTSLKDILQVQAYWLNDPSSISLIDDKLRDLKIYIPFWEASGAKINFKLRYDEVINFPKAFHNTYTATEQNRLRKKLAHIFTFVKIQKKLVSITSSTSVLNADIVYHPNSNYLEISAGNFGYPLYGYGIRAIDLGILGFLIAKQMAKSIVIRKNMKNDEWPETANQRYQELIECYSEKYTAFTNPPSKEYKRWQDTLKAYSTSLIDGPATAYYNLEDTIAFRTIDHALTEYFNDDSKKKIEGLPYLESRQLLTLAFATQFCHNDPTLMMPNPWRIRGTLIMNSDIFADTHYCESHNRMISADKCKPWS